MNVLRGDLLFLKFELQDVNNVIQLLLVNALLFDCIAVVCCALFTLNGIFGSLRGSFCFGFNINGFKLCFKSRNIAHIPFWQVLKSCTISLSDCKLFYLSLVLFFHLVKRTLGTFQTLLRVIQFDLKSLYFSSLLLVFFYLSWLLTIFLKLRWSCGSGWCS